VNGARDASGLHGIGNLSVGTPDEVSRLVETDDRAYDAAGVDPNAQLDVDLTGSSDDLHVVLHVEGKLKASHGMIVLTFVTRQTSHHHKGIANRVCRRREGTSEVHRKEGGTGQRR
jgi:hypothetical protein